MTSRRQFIKISFAGAGTLAAGGAAWGAVKWISGKDETGITEPPLSRTPTYCEVCFWKCAGWIYKDSDGQIWKIIGNDEDLNCNGRLCPRGTGGVGMYNDEDRLKTPLIRVEERGKQVFREASWDEAFTYIADKMKAIAREHGPECIALFTHGSGGKYFGDLLQAFGSNNIAAPSYAQLSLIHISEPTRPY
mgnify:FL=1